MMLLITFRFSKNLLPAANLLACRCLQNGYKIKVGTTDVETVGIDTPEDLQRAEDFLKNRK